jgi:hypothetical protein
MAITHVQWNWFSGAGSGYHTIDVNIAPATVIAQAVELRRFNSATTPPIW